MLSPLKCLNKESFLRIRAALLYPLDGSGGYHDAVLMVQWFIIKGDTVQPKQLAALTERLDNDARIRWGL
jgi:hypothetical protein